MTYVMYELSSIVNKWSEFTACVKCLEPDIVCGTESWLDGSIGSSEIFPKDYTVYRKDRHKGGGGAKKHNSWKNYYHFQKECRRDMRKAEWDYVNNTIEKGFREKNTKPFWNYVKRKRQDCVGVAPIKKDGKLYSDPKTKARILLEQFQSVFTRNDGSPLPAPTSSKRHPAISEITVEKKGVAKLLRDLNPANATGPDNIPNAILKECADHIAPALKIFQKSVDSGVRPSDWLAANVSCIFKNGDRHLAKN
ncbi:uncharacterized protein LOC141905229 [Tubulanus polymorphus]|uniref:uncharacterized protein LOC141905229 n=1 Tax=Tubulanus polymorphus TaxID=672921 RepID=UPI003DA3ECAB